MLHGQNPIQPQQQQYEEEEEERFPLSLPPSTLSQLLAVVHPEVGGREGAAAAATQLKERVIKEMNGRGRTNGRTSCNRGHRADALPLLNVSLQNTIAAGFIQ